MNAVSNCRQVSHAACNPGKINACEFIGISVVLLAVD